MHDKTSGNETELWDACSLSSNGSAKSSLVEFNFRDSFVNNGSTHLNNISNLPSSSNTFD